MSTVFYIIYAMLLVYSWLIVARVVLSWFPARTGGSLYAVKAALHALTEPYVRLFRRIIPVTRIGSVGLDLGMLVGLVVLFVLIQLFARL